MGNARIHENLSLWVKAESSIKSDCVGLGVQKAGWKTLLFGELQQLSKHCAADSLIAPGPQHRHAADLPVGK